MLWHVFAAVVFVLSLCNHSRCLRETPVISLSDYIIAASYKLTRSLGWGEVTFTTGGSPGNKHSGLFAEAYRVNYVIIFERA